MINKMGLENDILRVLLTEEQIQAKVKELGERISRDYAGKNPLLVCILRGAVPFYADLCKHIDDYMEMDFMAVSSYEDGMTSHGIVRIKKDLDVSIENRHVLIVEDIMDSGNTLNHLTRLLGTRNPASLRIACLLGDESAEERMTAIGRSLLLRGRVREKEEVLSAIERVTPEGVNRLIRETMAQLCTGSVRDEPRDRCMISHVIST